MRSLIAVLGPGTRRTAACIQAGFAHSVWHRVATNTLQSVAVIATTENTEVNELVHGDVQPSLGFRLWLMLKLQVHVVCKPGHCSSTSARLTWWPMLY